MFLNRSRLKHSSRRLSGLTFQVKRRDQISTLAALLSKVKRGDQIGAAMTIKHVLFNDGHYMDVSARNLLIKAVFPNAPYNFLPTTNIHTQRRCGFPYLIENVSPLQKLLLLFTWSSPKVSLASVATSERMSSTKPC